MTQSAIIALNFAEKYEKQGYYKKADHFTRIAQMSELNPDLLKLLIQSTDKNEIYEALKEFGLDTRQKAMRFIGKYFHPDINHDAPGLGEQLFKKIKNAYLDPRQRLDDLSGFIKGTPYEHITAPKTTYVPPEEPSPKTEPKVEEPKTEPSQPKEEPKATKINEPKYEPKTNSGNVGFNNTAKPPGVATEAAEAAETATMTAKAESLSAAAAKNPAFTKVMQFFQKAAPAMKWLPPVAVALELAAKYLSGEQLDGFDFGKMIAGMMLIPPVAAAIAAIPIIGPALVTLAAVGAFGGLDIARFLTDPTKGLDLMGMNVALNDAQYDKMISDAISNARYAKNNISDLCFLLQEKAINDMINDAIRHASNKNKIFKIAQSTQYSLYDSYSKINTSSLQGIASSIKTNVQGLINELKTQSINPNELVNFENWANIQIQAAEKYKTESTTTFSGFGVGEARKLEVQNIVNSLNAIPKIRNYISKMTKSVQPVERKPIQMKENYFTKAKIDPNIYTGTVEQNEILRRTINPSSPNFYEAFKLKFGKWIDSPKERIPLLSGTKP